MSTFVILVLIACLFAGVTLLRRREFAGAGTLSLFRILLPSWRFFDEPRFVPRLEYRYRVKTNTFTEWQSGILKPKLGFSSLFFNAEGNLQLAGYTLVERLVDDINSVQTESADTLMQSTSYQLTENWVRYHLRQRGVIKGVFQFKVSLPSESSASDHEILISSEHRLDVLDDKAGES